MTHSGVRPLGLGMLAALGLFALIGQSCGPTLTYSCQSPHCYGIVYLTLSNPVLFRLTLDTPVLNGGDGHTSDELWLGQYPNPACKGDDTSDAPNCWVEVGLCAGDCFIYSMEGPSPNPAVAHYFWADAPPSGTFIAYDLGVVAPEQLGQPLVLTIAKLPLPTQPDSFVAYVGPYGGVSNNNTMSTNYVQFGLELSGTMSASALDAHFTNLYLIDSSGGAYLGGYDINWWNNVIVDMSPVDANWEIFPTQSPTGGKFHTSLK
jgi:hypothetical protein